MDNKTIDAVIEIVETYVKKYDEDVIKNPNMAIMTMVMISEMDELKSKIEQLRKPLK